MKLTIFGRVLNRLIGYFPDENGYVWFFFYQLFTWCSKEYAALKL